jgi:hypothetical protein
MSRGVSTRGVSRRLTHVLPCAIQLGGQTQAVPAAFASAGSRHSIRRAQPCPRGTIPAGQTQLVPAEFGTFGSLHSIGRTHPLPATKVVPAAQVQAVSELCCMVS